MGENGVLVFPDAARSAASSIDPNLLLALQNGGGFGNGGNWIWIIFLWMMWQNGGFQNFRNNGGSFAELSAQMSNSEGRQYLAEIMGGRFDNLGQLSQIINTGVETVKNGIFALQNNISQVGANAGLSAAETRNAILLGNANLSQQLCECCCNMRYDLAQQTNTLQAQAASNHASSQLQASQNFAAQQLQSANNFAAQQLQAAQNHADDRLDICQQTNALQNQAERDTTSILGAINQQSIMINEKFCDLEKRELQNRINSQGDTITQLRGQISNDAQSDRFDRRFTALETAFANFAAKQPNTVPVVYPNVTAVNNTPNVGPGYYPGNNPGYNNWNGSFWG